MLQSPQKTLSMNFWKNFRVHLEDIYAAKLNIQKHNYSNTCPIKSFIILAVLCEAGGEHAGFISTSLHPGNTAFFEEMSQRWRAVGNTVSNLTGPRFEPLTSHSREECVIFNSTNYNVYCRVAIITLLNNSWPTFEYCFVLMRSGHRTQEKCSHGALHKWPIGSYLQREKK